MIFYTAQQKTLLPIMQVTFIFCVYFGMMCCFVPSIHSITKNYLTPVRKLNKQQFMDNSDSETNYLENSNIEWKPDLMKEENQVQVSDSTQVNVKESIQKLFRNHHGLSKLSFPNQKTPEKLENNISNITDRIEVVNGGVLSDNNSLEPKSIFGRPQYLHEEKTLQNNFYTSQPKSHSNDYQNFEYNAMKDRSTPTYLIKHTRVDKDWPFQSRTIYLIAQEYPFLKPQSPNGGLDGLSPAPKSEYSSGNPYGMPLPLLPKSFPKKSAYDMFIQSSAPEKPCKNGIEMTPAQKPEYSSGGAYKMPYPLPPPPPPPLPPSPYPPPPPPPPKLSYPTKYENGMSPAPKPAYGNVMSSPPKPAYGNAMSSLPRPAYSNVMSSPPKPAYGNAMSSPPEPAYGNAMSSPPKPEYGNVMSSPPKPAYGNAMSSPPKPAYGNVMSSPPKPAYENAMSSLSKPAYGNVMSLPPKPAYGYAMSSPPKPAYGNVMSSPPKPAYPTKYGNEMPPTTIPIGGAYGTPSPSVPKPEYPSEGATAMSLPPQTEYPSGNGYGMPSPTKNAYGNSMAVGGYDSLISTFMDVKGKTSNFGYEVDNKVNDFHNHRQTDDGVAATGSYSWRDEKGNLNTVDYVADHVTGYRATVRNAEGGTQWGFVQDDKEDDNGGDYGASGYENPSSPQLSLNGVGYGNPQPNFPKQQY